MSTSERSLLIARGATFVRHALRVAAVVTFSSCLLVALFGRNALAHAVGVSRGEYSVDGTAVAIHLTFARAELVSTFPKFDIDHDGVISEADLTRGRDEMARALAGFVIISSGSKPCAEERGAVRLTEEDGVAFDATYRCSVGAQTVRVELNLLRELPHGHRHLAHLVGGPTSTSSDIVLFRGSEAFELTATSNSIAGSSRGSFWSLLLMGIEHIATGYDHLVFLLCLVLVGGRPRSLLGVVSAFTLGHSLSLSLAVLGVLTPSARIVEPAIALSIAYVGVENFFLVDAKRRWRITLPFGLIHGFGFASALTEIGLPRQRLPLALLSFNLGVEVGQLAVLAIALPVILWARSFPRFRDRGVKLLSAAIVVAGLVWFVLRVASVGS